MATKKTPKSAPKDAARKPAPAKKAAPAPAAEPAAELIGLEEMARQLHLPALHLRKMVQAHQVPGVKVEGQWKFNPRLVQEAMLRRSRGM